MHCPPSQISWLLSHSSISGKKNLNIFHLPNKFDNFFPVINWGKNVQIDHYIICYEIFVGAQIAAETIAAYAFNPWPIFIPDLAFPDISVHFSDA